MEPILVDEVADLLAFLTDKSLVIWDESTERFRLLETVREFARGRLAEQEESDPVRDRHLACFTALGEEAEPHLASGDQQTWLERLGVEHDNLRAALRWGGASRPQDAVRLAGAIWRFWYVRCHFAEGRERIGELLSLSAADGDDPARAKLLTGAGVLAWCQGEYAPSRALFEQSLAIHRQRDDRPGVGMLLNNLGNVAYDQGDYPAARALFEESLALRREAGDARGVAATLNNLGNVASDQADYAEARELFEESLQIKREIADRWGIASSLSNLGIVTFQQGDYGCAGALFEESLSIRRELGDPSGAAISQNNLGNVALAENDFGGAASLFRESLSVGRSLGARWGISFSLEGLAAAEAGLGGWERAAFLWGAAEKLREELGAPIPPNDLLRYEHAVENARSAAREGAFSAAWQEGRGATLHQALARALE